MINKIMFCHKCGKPEQTPESYCRNCGEYLPDFSRKNKMSFGGDTPQENVSVTLFLSALSSIVGFASAIALYATFLGQEGVPSIVYLVAAFCLCIGFWQASNVYINLKLRKRFKDVQGKNNDEGITAELGAPKQNTELPPADFENFVPPSVVENTTKIFDKMPR
jgi:hypothetical protein